MDWIEQLKAFWYFFGGIILFGFYISNLFVGVMFEAFLSFKNMDSRGSLISQAERRWRDYEKRLCRVGQDSSVPAGRTKPVHYTTDIAQPCTRSPPKKKKHSYRGTDQFPSHSCF